MIDNKRVCLLHSCQIGVRILKLQSMRNCYLYYNIFPDFETLDKFLIFVYSFLYIWSEKMSSYICATVQWDNRFVLTQ